MAGSAVLAAASLGQRLCRAGRDTELQLLPADDAYEVEVQRAPGGCTVTVTAAALAKDLALFPDRLDAAPPGWTPGWSPCWLGSSPTFTVTGTGLDEVGLTTRPVLRSVNDVIGR